MDFLQYPWWLRAEHLVNILFLTIFIRSGIEILGTFPKLHRSIHTQPGKQWAQFSIKEKRHHKFFPVSGEYEDYSPIVSLPGHGDVGQGRYWHFISVVLWVAMMIVYWVVLIATGQIMRYVPSDWSVFGQAWQNIVSYLAFVVPEPMDGYPFNAVQQLSYGFVVIILPLWMMVTGAFQSPAINNHFPRISRAMGGRQVIRTLHWWGLAAYLMFVVIHVLMVILHGFGHETSKMIFGTAAYPVAGGLIFGAALVLIVFCNVWATKSSTNHPAWIARLNNALVRPLTRFLRKHSEARTTTYEAKDVTPAQNHRASGMPPSSEEYMAMLCNNWDDYVLEIGGLVKTPMRFSVADLRRISDGYFQRTVHHCVQGFSSLGEWDGVPLERLLALVEPLEGASDVVVQCFQNMTRDDDLYSGSYYYETVPMVEATQPKTLIAFGYQGEELPMKVGAPCRLRLETSTGFRSAKWIERIEVVNRFDIIGNGKGGFFEDTDSYDRLQMI